MVHLDGLSFALYELCNWQRKILSVSSSGQFSIQKHGSVLADLILLFQSFESLGHVGPVCKCQRLMASDNCVGGLLPPEALALHSYCKGHLLESENRGSR